MVEFGTSRHCLPCRRSWVRVPSAASDKPSLRAGFRSFSSLVLTRSGKPAISSTALRELAELAPLHQPKSLAALAAVRRALPGIPCFDTAFHATLPSATSTYALPRAWRKVPAGLGVIDPARRERARALRLGWRWHDRFVGGREEPVRPAPPCPSSFATTPCGRASR